MPETARQSHDISAAHILSALSTVTDPVTGGNIVSAGMVSGITIRDKRVGFIITIEPKDKDAKSSLQDAAKQAVMKYVPEAESVTVILTAESKSVAPAESPKAKAVWNLTPLENVKKVIAIASGKGGVGKSTTAVNLARALMRKGLKVGLLDADIYGPSLPRMMHLSGQPQVTEGKMQPLVSSDGIPCMSMGFVAGEETALVWRGPQITKALHQLLRLTNWPPLDILLVDMPPGTGDVHISMVQQVPLSGAILVTTPQEVALMDARKCADMFGKVNVPLLGVIENMSYFEDPAGNKHRLFGEGGGEKLAKEKDTVLLGSVPLDAQLGKASDTGSAAISGASKAVYDALAGSTLGALSA